MLTHKIAIYVPSTINGNTKAPPEVIKENVDKAKKTFALLFGGFTSTPAQGGWYSPTHGLIQEDIQIVYSFTDDEGFKKVDEITQLARDIAKSMTQEAVTVEIGGSVQFVTV